MDVLDQWRAQSTEKFIPLQASLELTYRCNERCTHCYIDNFWDDPNKVLTFENWISILNELKNAGTLYLVLMGGEAMLHHYFWDIAEAARKRGFHLSLITNGLKINNLKTAQRLKEIPFHHINFSLYSLNPEIHDKMTSVAGSHKKTMDAIDLCRQVGLQIGINCLLTKANIADYFALANWCVEREIEIKEDPAVTARFGGDLSPLKLRASDDQLEKFYRQRAKLWPKSLPRAESLQGNDYVCNIAKGKCAINPYGDLLGCTEVRRPLGNLLKNDFQTIWHNESAYKWRNIKVKDIKNRAADVSHCGESTHCEHCPGMALSESYDPLILTEDSVRLARIKKAVSVEFARTE